MVVSEAILAEYARVLRYPRHRLKHELSDFQLAELDDAFREFSSVVMPDQTPTAVTDDPKDDQSLAAGVAGMVDMVVSGDKHLLSLSSYGGIPIMTPVAFVLSLRL